MRRLKSSQGEHVLVTASSRMIQIHDLSLDVCIALIPKHLGPWKTQAACWHCVHTFDWVPLSMPTKYNKNKKLFSVSGIFCSWPCMKAFNLAETRNGQVEKIFSNIALLKETSDWGNKTRCQGHQRGMHSAFSEERWTSIHSETIIATTKRYLSEPSSCQTSSTPPRAPEGVSVRPLRPTAS